MFNVKYMHGVPNILNGKFICEKMGHLYHSSITTLVLQLYVYFLIWYNVPEIKGELSISREYLINPLSPGKSAIHYEAMERTTLLLMLEKEMVMR